MMQAPGQDRMQEVVDRCMRNDLKAQTTLYLHFYGFARSLIYADHQEEIGEVINDGFVKVFENLKGLQNSRSLKPWIKRIMINTAIDHYRKHNRGFLNVPLEQANLVTTEKGIYSRLDRDEILQAVNRLPNSLSTVFNLYVVKGHSHQEISQRLSITRSASRSYLSTAKKRLREMLRDY